MEELERLKKAKEKLRQVKENFVGSTAQMAPFPTGSIVSKGKKVNDRNT